MKKKRNVPRFSIAAGLTWRIGVLVGVLWLVAMGLLTVIGAIQLQNQWAFWVRASVPLTDEELPGALERQRIQKMYALDAQSRVFLDLPLYKDPTHYRNPYKNPDTTYETGIVFFEDGQPVMTGSNYAVLTYQTQENWQRGSSEPDGIAYIDLDKTPDAHGLKTGIWSRISTGISCHSDLYRLTGYFEGNQFVLAQLAGWNMRYPELYEGKSPAQWETEKGLAWEIHYENPEILTDDLVQIYTTEILSYCRMSESSFPRLRIGQQISLSDALLSETPRQYESDSLWDSVLMSESTVVDDQGTEHRVLSAIHCHPMLSAMERMMPIYVAAELVAVAVVVWFYILIKRRLRDPLQQIIRKGQDNMLPLRFPYKPKWKEPYLLEQGYMTAQQQIQSLRQENQQLKTALDYAREAEDKRRQLISDITHELKTPLAVISSYAEGLQAEIAPQKRQRYLDVITSEAQKMDTMVLSILDLSRLEAGKVRLAQDPVELLSLTRSVFEKLQPLLQSRGLTVIYAIENTCHLTGDETRLEQVITNLASNAIKYSTPGGQIILKLFQRNGNTHFFIENPCAPLPQEALEKIWDSFYRTEESRSSEGTGLGLSISKAIIELHRGTCQVRNTSTGVEFSFLLPV